MLSVDWVTLVLKLVLVPIFIGAVSLAGRRWGSTVGGWLIGLPLTSGLVAFFLAVEQGDAFAFKAAEAIMLGVVSVFAFCLVYGWMAMRFGWLQSILAAVAAFFASTFLLEKVSLPLILEVMFTLLILAVCLFLMPHVGSDRMSATCVWWEVPARMVSATALVLVITGVAQLFGPQLTGLLTPFPIYAATLAVFIHRSLGGEEAVKLLRGLIVGSITFVVFFLVLSLTLLAWGIAASFLTAIGTGFLTHFTTLQLLRGAESKVT